jgi:hypothetical protein
MNFPPRSFRALHSLPARLLAFVILAGAASAAAALDSTRYAPLRTGYQWSYKNASTSTGFSNTSTVGNQVRLATGVLAFAVENVTDDPDGYPSTSYQTSDQYGGRSHQVGTGDTAITWSPPNTYLPPNPVVGNTYTYNSTVNGISSSITTSISSNIQIAGFETIANYNGTQSWSALKVIYTTTGTSVIQIPGSTPLTTTSTSVSTNWYVDGIGVVRYAYPNASGVVETWKLTSTNVVPFVVAVTATITATSASVATKITFKPAEVGKTGAVYVTAVVPSGSLVPASAGMNAVGASSAATAATAYVLIQLTPTGWQLVVNGQLFPYSSGLLGDLLAAQTILSNADATALKGAQFCLGYGASAEEMAAAGRMQYVATIPDPNATTSTPASCLIGLPLALAQGWNLIGNSAGAALDVAAAFGDTTKVASVWKWLPATGKWAFYTPSLAGQALTDYASGKGYEVLSAAYAGEGVWVNAKSAFGSSLSPGAPVTAVSFQSMGTGWNLIAVGEGPSPSLFNKALSTTALATGEIPLNLATLWAWNAATSAWYFYAPSLEKSGTLASYITSKSYLDFGTKLLDPSMGFWVNKQ